MYDERELYVRKWFDYRILSPDMATLAFINGYSREYREYLRLADHEGAQKRDVLSSLNFANITGWKHWKVMRDLRQWADERRLPYGSFWSMAFKAYNDSGRGLVTAKRKKGKGTTTMVIVNFFKARDILDRVDLARAEFFDSQLQLSRLPFLQAEHYVGHRVQDEYHRYVLTELERRHGKSAQERAKTLIQDGRISLKFFQRLKNKEITL